MLKHLDSKKTDNRDVAVKFSLKDSETVEKEAKDVIRNLKIQKKQSEYSTRNFASYTESRIEAELKESMSKGTPDYANSCIAWVDPLDYLNEREPCYTVRKCNPLLSEFQKFSYTLPTQHHKAAA